MSTGTQTTHTEISFALDLAVELAARYGMAALSGPLASARATARQDEISVAVLGRFKAGKSSFLNHLAGRDVLPTGVIPVTAVVTELGYGARARAMVHGRDGHAEEIRLEEAGSYIAEKENPENSKDVCRIGIELPELGRLRGLRFVDTPGLDSALEHNTRTSLEWMPKAGLALVAISVDPPLSAQDLDLLKSLYRHTPRIAILLTKADLLSSRELAEVVEFVRAQLARNFAEPPAVFPYSVKPGYEHLRDALEAELFAEVLEHLQTARESILTRKADTVLGEAGAYLALALKSAELEESEREALKRMVVGEKETLDPVRATIRLVVQHAMAQTRAQVSERLETHEAALDRRLLEAFESEFPRWNGGLASMLSGFEAWLARTLSDSLAEVSGLERGSLLAGLGGARRQVFETLQNFRDRLSERTLRGFGVALDTTESEIAVVEPGAPDIHVGRVFDRNWELLSPVLPVWTIRRPVRGHFARTIPRAVYSNLSRLGAQWEESIHAALRRLETEAQRRLEELAGTVDRLITGDGGKPLAGMRADLERIRQARQTLRGLP